MNYDNLLPLFVSKDELRPAMMQPNECGDFVFATDAFAAIMIPKTFLEKTYVPHVKAPNIKHVLGLSVPIKPVQFSSDDLFAILKKIPKEYDTKNCPACVGDGYIECPRCSNHEDCQDCNASGVVTDKTAPRVFPHKDHFIKIGETVFSAYQIGRMAKALKNIELKSFSLVGAKKEKQHLFQVGEAQILIMPVTTETAYRMKVYELTSKAE